MDIHPSPQPFTPSLTATLSPGDAEPLLRNDLGEQYLYSVNRHTFAKVGSRVLFDSNFNWLLFSQDTLYIIVGTDSGLLLEYVREHEPVPGSRYVFLELPEVRKRLEEEYDWSELPDHIDLFSRLDWRNTVIHYQDYSSYIFTSRAKVVRSFAARDAYRPEYAELFRNAKEGIDEDLARGISSIGHQLFIERQLQNACDNSTAAARLKERFKGKLCVLLAGGPSLDEVLPWVKEHRDELYVMAVSRTSKRLLQEGIVPDFVYAIDPYPISFNVSRDIFRFADQCLFVYGYHVHPGLIQQWPGKAAYLGQLLPWQTLEESGNIGIGAPTVANTAVAAAIAMGFATVVFAGVDNCYSKEGYSHAKGSAEYQAGPAFQETSQVVKTNDGELAETIYDFVMAIGAFKEQAREAAEKGCRLINPVGSAAAIEGIDYVPLDRIEIPPGNRAAHPYEELFPGTTRDSRLAHLDELEREIKATRQELRTMRGMVDEALGYNDKLFDKEGRVRDEKYRFKMNRIEERLNKKHKALADLARLYGMKLFTRALVPSERDWQEGEEKRWGESYYSYYGESIKALRTRLEEVLERLAVRRIEESERPDLPALAKSWRGDGVPGRIRVLAARNPAGYAHCQATWPELAAELEEEFRQQLSSEWVLEQKSDRFRDPALLRAKARLLHGYHDLPRLRNLLQGMANFEAEGIGDLRHLVEGYCAELENDPAAALEAYGQVGEGGCLEDALARMSSLLIDAGDLDNGLLALECMTHISPYYIPVYADLLRLQGKVGEALDEYEKYFRQCPGDTITMVKLGRIYEQLGHPEGAVTVYRHVLELAPEHKTAAELLKRLENGSSDPSPKALSDA